MEQAVGADASRNQLLRTGIVLAIDVEDTGILVVAIAEIRPAGQRAFDNRSAVGRQEKDAEKGRRDGHPSGEIDSISTHRVGLHHLGGIAQPVLQVRPGLHDVHIVVGSRRQCRLGDRERQPRHRLLRVAQTSVLALGLLSENNIFS